MEKPDNCTDEMYVLPSFVCYKEALATASVTAAKTSLLKGLGVFSNFVAIIQLEKLENWNFTWY